MYAQNRISTAPILLNACLLHDYQHKLKHATGSHNKSLITNTGCLSAPKQPPPRAFYNTAEPLSLQAAYTLTANTVIRAKPYLGLLYLLQLVLQAGSSARLAVPSHRPVPAANFGVIDALLHQCSHLLLSRAWPHQQTDQIYCAITQMQS